MAEQLRLLPTTRPASFFATASGGIGWGLPAAVGIALGDRARGVKRTWSPPSATDRSNTRCSHLYRGPTPLPIVFVVMRNGEYSILKSFAVLEKSPGVPGLDLPGLDIASLAAGFGCRTVNVDSTEKLARRIHDRIDRRRTHRHRGADQT